MSGWNILTRTYGGTVSLLKGLSEDEARGVMQRLRKPHDPWERGNPWVLERAVAEERNRRAAQDDFNHSGVSYRLDGGDLEQIECWGPQGETLVVWPKPDDWDERWAEALRKLDEEAPAPPRHPDPTPSPGREI